MDGTVLRMVPKLDFVMSVVSDMGMQIYNFKLKNRILYCYIKLSNLHVFRMYSAKCRL